jgi:inosine/xanthosine triphosphate pyrophosphatase family protein/dephospho-CoA kinase
VDSAIEQCKKSSLDSRQSLFLIEDTSVRIDALSDGLDFPGLEIKYWMEDTSFNQLNKKLGKKNRIASVRSDMVLFNIDKSIYEHFNASIDGEITKNEIPNLQTNLIFPWLDNQSFNKWFVPKGFTKPISTLSIKEAKKIDFRKKTFQKLIKFLYKNAFITKYDPHKKNLKKQPELFKKKLVLLVGYSCSGKTTIAQYLLRQFQWQHFEASDFMRLEFYERHGINSCQKLECFAKELLENSPKTIPIRIIQEIENIQYNIVITGFRSPKELEQLEKSLNHKFTIETFFIQAPIDIRVKRAKLRCRGEDTEMSTQKMMIRDKTQSEMGLNKFKANSSVIENTRTKKKLEHNVDLYIRANKNDGNRFIFHKNENLRVDIFKFLFKQYDSNTSFTTTEISKKIPHHKDNISRFFNQKFHSDFEIIKEDNINKFKLSNSGYSKAFLMINSNSMPAFPSPENFPNELSSTIKLTSLKQK